jgi:hypothetical protein
MLRKCTELPGWWSLALRLKFAVGGHEQHRPAVSSSSVAKVTKVGVIIIVVWQGMEGVLCPTDICKTCEL